MTASLGIGIVTFNRSDVLLETLNRVRAHTSTPCIVVVADDGSDDGTADALRAQQITVATGPNMGIAWNKNRALFQLGAVMQCDAVILLEDDFPYAGRLGNRMDDGQRALGAREPGRSVAA